ncbi:MAG: hypothetical protein WBJ10_06695 [Daejeonella sp.]|uniref:hypothetical protein n=1 Tax=Daejeonella sp. TaxID=2805397 RepID=UPI003C77D497
MEQTNSQELDKKLFSDCVYNPAGINSTDKEVLEGLVGKYPYAQLLRSFYTRSLIDTSSDTFDKELSKTAIFSADGVVLRKIIEDPESIKSQARSILSTDTNIAESPDTASEKEEVADKRTDEPESEAEFVVEDETLFPENEEAVGEVQPDGDLENIQAAEPELAFSDSGQSPESSKEDQKYHEFEDGELIETPIDDTDTTQPETPTVHDELDLLVRQSAASSYFSREEKGLDAESDKTENVFRPENDIAQNISHNAVIDDRQSVSRYDDDKMPYSFLWWLDKTRKEHSQNYQPYVSFHLDTSQSIKRNTVDQLSSQIIENIFHLQSPVDELENAPKTVPFQVKRKEDFIVEKFIREEPQIKPPNSDKLDNENKARKSAEDPNDLVSETLAHIYTDQMLFHKAIETYKKLSLKFPEKSTYFADQIRELEKKIN